MSYSLKHPKMLVALAVFLLGQFSLASDDVNMGNRCRDDSSCPYDNSHCDTDPNSKDYTYCVCNQYYAQDPNGYGCISVLDLDCSTDSDCSSIDHSVCGSDGTCVCEGGTPHNWTPVEGRCVQLDYDLPCYDSSNCDSTMQCTNDLMGYCVCKPGYVFYGYSCYEDTGITCTSDSDCTAKDNVCNMMYDSDTEGVCILYCNYFDGVVKIDGECVPNVQCNIYDYPVPNANIYCRSGQYASTGEVCDFNCRDGYDGDSHVTCQDSNNDGVGDFGTLPTCYPTEICANQPAGNIADPKSCYCYYTCDGNGGGQQNCCANAHWDQEKNKCVFNLGSC